MIGKAFSHVSYCARIARSFSAERKEGLIAIYVNDRLVKIFFELNLGFLGMMMNVLISQGILPESK